MPLCQNPWNGGCTTEADSMGLLFVSNPDASNPEGGDKKVFVCSLHTATWTQLWGTWPITEEEKAMGWDPNGTDRIREERKQTRERAAELMENALELAKMAEAEAIRDSIPENVKVHKAALQLLHVARVAYELASATEAKPLVVGPGGPR